MKDEIEMNKQQLTKKIAQKGPQKQTSADISLGAGTEGLINLLKQKADVTDLEKLNELKSNRVDCEAILDIQTMMSKQFKQLLVLFVEITNC